MNEIAILMAAGLGSRMRPLTDRIAKPLVEVGGTPLIETVIAALRQRCVGEIHVVVGYKHEQFGYLEEKYPELKLVENREYQTKNNVSSIAAAAEAMGKADCFVCEADLYVPDAKLLCRELGRSGYFGKFVSGASDDWVFDTTSDKVITGIHKVGADRYNMVGISYFRQADAAKVAAACKVASAAEGCQLFWDEVVDGLLGEMPLVVHEVADGDIVECDTIADLERLNEGLKK